MVALLICPSRSADMQGPAALVKALRMKHKGL